MFTDNGMSALALSGLDTAWGRRSGPKKLLAPFRISL